jgi:outer membrane protein assembly factor BamA
VIQHEYSYNIKRLGAGITLQRKLSDESATFLTYSVENDRLNISDQFSSDLSKTESLHNKSGFTAGYSINTTKNVFEPNDGWKWNASLTYMGIGFNSKYHYLKMTVDGRNYLQFMGNWVLASRVNLGFIEPLQGDLQTPLEDRFLLGGASSLRGWGRNAIALISKDGLLVGGNYMAEANLEIRIPIYDIFSGVVFADAGNIWNSALDLPVLRLDTGMGLRAKSPIGPIRLDVGFPIGENKFKPQFFIMIGHAF